MSAAVPPSPERDADGVPLALLACYVTGIVALSIRVLDKIKCRWDRVSYLHQRVIDRDEGEEHIKVPSEVNYGKQNLTLARNACGRF